MYRSGPIPSSPNQASPGQSTPASAVTATSAGDERRQVLASLLRDREWTCDPLTRVRLEALQQCLRPATTMGTRDSACPAEAEWALLANEIERYLDFRRLRHLEAQLHHCTDAEFHFDRHAWEVAHAAEAALAAHLRHVHEESYVPEQVDLYLHVH